MILRPLIEFAALALAVPAGFSCAYLLLATLLSAPPRAPARASGSRRYDVVVPAHNEAAVIARTVRSLRAIAWPKDRYRIIVVADNCVDATARIARDEGALVLERHDTAKRGKGHALAFAFERSSGDGWADAVVVVDADSEVSANFLEAIDGRLGHGACAVQVHYGVLNPHDSWRTRLIAIAKGAFHVVRSRARERLGLSCGIRGNGWCVTHGLLRQVPYRAFSMTEDIEYGIDLGLAGVRVHYADEAHCDGEMVSNAKAAQSQRRRWEGGRLQLIRSRTWPLLRNAVTRRDPITLDLAFDLMVLPLSYVTLNVLALTFVAGILRSLEGSAGTVYVPVAAACGASIALYVLRGWQLSGTGVRGLRDLACAPFFLAWKVASMVTRPRSAGWVKTDRERH